MKTFRITLQAVFDIEADSDEEAWSKLPDQIGLDEVYILDTEEIEEE